MPVKDPRQKEWAQIYKIKDTLLFVPCIMHSLFAIDPSGDTLDVPFGSDGRAVGQALRCTLDSCRFIEAEYVRETFDFNVTARFEIEWNERVMTRLGYKDRKNFERTQIIVSCLENRTK